MSMTRYETLLLLKTEATEEEISSLENSFDTIASKHNGTIALFDLWGKCRLAYPVQKMSFGVYILVRYDIEPSDMAAFAKELDALLSVKLNDIVMRYVNVKIRKGASLDYKRPAAVDSFREGSKVDAFLKSSKVKGILDSVEGITKSDKKAGEDKPAEEPATKIEEPKKIEEPVKAEEPAKVEDKPEEATSAPVDEEGE
ncbi:30S ribosomal protein S6 [bacterium]|nr:30S ribosomal protein S6 [bacterium]